MTEEFLNEEKLNHNEFEDLQSLDPNQLSRDDLSLLENTAGLTVARFLERLSVDESRSLLRDLSEEKAVEVLSEMEPEFSADILEAMRDARAVSFLEEIDPDDVADIVGEFEDTDRERLLGQLKSETQETIEELLSYDSDTAGGIMTPEVATVRDNLNVDEAIFQIRQQREALETIYYIYIVDASDKLRGVVSMRNLMFAKPKSTISSILNEKLLGVCHINDDKELVALEMAKYNLVALPIVDDDFKLVGIVTHDDAIDVIHDEATEDIQKMVGAGADEGIHDGVLLSVRRRTPWLFINLFTTAFAGGIIYLFQSEISEFTLLAVFLPVVASIGGNAGSQTLAISIRGLAMGELDNSESVRTCFKESMKGVLEGVIVGLFASMIAYFVCCSAGESQSQSFRIAIALFFSMIMTMGLATFTGIFIPLSLKKLNFDPAQSSSIFLTAITDICGFFIFLKIGVWLLL